MDKVQEKTIRLLKGDESLIVGELSAFGYRVKSKKPGKKRFLWKTFEYTFVREGGPVDQFMAEKEKEFDLLFHEWCDEFLMKKMPRYFFFEVFSLALLIAGIVLSILFLGGETSYIGMIGLLLVVLSLVASFILLFKFQKRIKGVRLMDACAIAAREHMLSLAMAARLEKENKDEGPSKD